MIRRTVRAGVLCLAACGVSHAVAGPVEVVVSTDPQHVPAIDGGAHLTAIGVPVASPDGRWWMVRAQSLVQGGDAEDVILVGGSGGAGGIAVIARRPSPGWFGIEMNIADDGSFAVETVDVASGQPTAAVLRGRAAAGGSVEFWPAAAPTPALAADLAVIPIEDPDPASAAPFEVGSLVVTPGGDWLVRGLDAGGCEWVFRNGAPFALAGGPATANPTKGKRYEAAAGSPAFFSMHANSAGDLALGGMVRGGADGVRASVVYNRQRIILREGDTVRMGNSEAFIHAFRPDSAFLTDSGWYYVTAELRDASGEVLGHGLLRMRICRPDWDASGVANTSDISAFLAEWMISRAQGCDLADYNRDGRTDTADITAFLAEWMRAAAGGC